MPPTLYETLELPPLADEASVKSAYRKLARKYHPDLNPTQKRQAEERFKAINEAYNTLSNVAKKQAYDATLRAMGNMANHERENASRQEKTPSGPPSPKAPPPQSARKPSPPPPPPSPPPSASQAKKPEPKPDATSENSQPSLQDVFRAFWQPTSGVKSGTEKPPRQKNLPPKRGRDVQANVSISSEEALKGCQKTLSVSLGPSCSRCAGTGKLNGLVCPTCHGESYVLKPTSLDIKLPTGVTHQAKVRIAGQGLAGLFGGPPGDLFVMVSVMPAAETSFKAKEPASREQTAPGSKSSGEKTLSLSNVEHRGLNIHAELSVSIPMGVLGGQVKVLTPSGVVQLSIPPLLSSGKTLKLKRQGQKQNGQMGDLLITLHLAAPERLSAAEKKLYEALRDLSNE